MMAGQAQNERWPEKRKSVDNFWRAPINSHMLSPHWSNALNTQQKARLLSFQPQENNCY